MQSQIVSEQLDVDKKTVDLFNTSIHRTFKIARNVVNNNSLLPFAVKTIFSQKDASRRRQAWRKKGIHVPPVIIFSVTKRCNLKCKGCYAHTQNRIEQDLPIERIQLLFEEAKELGASIIIIVGGEPLMRPKILGLAGFHKDIIFPVFTNGLMINQTLALMLRYNRNIVPIISIEGPQEITDCRRGSGMYNRIIDKMRLLRNNGIFFGASITVTSENLLQVTSEDFVSKMADQGVKTMVYVEYIPVDHQTQNLVLSRDQKKILESKLEILENKYKMVFINFPGDEDKFGGCLAAGRGFIHVSQSGVVEPCPASPYSDVDLSDCSLKEALKSPLLKKIRQTPHSLIDSPSGCALFDKEEWVKSLVLNSNNTYE
jgi:MoaA/NifB/PqqE/SkfB family radical SAM enzyme